MKNASHILKILTVSLSVLALFACNPVARDAQSPSLLLVESILGYTANGDEATFLESDVLRWDEGLQDYVVFTDTASITLRGALLDPDSVSGPSQYNDITLTGYDVTYSLPGGGGTAGVDVPQPITGSVSSVLVEIGTSTTVPFPVVLNLAKNATPLVELGGTLGVLQCIAEITFRGHDQLDNPVEATGHLTIYFADYADTVPAAPIKR